MNEGLIGTSSYVPKPVSEAELIARAIPPELTPSDRVVDSVTVNEQVSHRQTGELEMEGVTTAYTRKINTNEQMYTRKSKVGEEWKSLDYGHLQGQGVSYLYIRNTMSDRDLGRKMSEEEKADLAKKIIELRYEDSTYYFLLPPQESLRVSPSHKEKLLIRSQHGEARYTLYAFPD